MRDEKQVWTEQQERLLAAAQAVVNNASEHERNQDGERVTTVFPEDFAALKAIVQEISDDAVKEIEEIQQSVPLHGNPTHYGTANGPACGAHFQHEGLSVIGETAEVTCHRCKWSAAYKEALKGRS